MIRGVTFDWWHTVAETPWPDYDERMRRLRVEAIREALAEEGILVEEDLLRAAYDDLTDRLAAHWAEYRDLGPAEQIRSLLDFAGIREGGPSLENRIAEAFGQAIRTKPPILYPHIGSTLARLKREGYAVGLVSNTGRTWGRYLRPIQDELGIGKHFDIRVFSDEVGVRKPDRGIFERALEGLGLPPSDLVHVGDDVEADVVGAKAVGMRAVWFNTGFWPGARADAADAEIRDHSELFDVLARWKG